MEKVQEMKPWAVVVYPEDIREHWFFETVNGRHLREVQMWGALRVAEKRLEVNPLALDVTFYETEVYADLAINEILRQNPGRTLLKMKTTEVAQVSVGPVQRAVVTDAGMLPAN